MKRTEKLIIFGGDCDLIISHKHKFIVYSPWKTASSTLNSRLSDLNESPYDRFHYLNPYLNRVVTQHITCADFHALPESHLGYFSASFVRNPYDRVYSGFFQLQSMINNQPKRPFPSPWIRNLVLDQLKEIYAQLSSAGFDFDSWVALLDEGQILEIGRNTNFPLHPAHYWTHVGGKKAVDFIGRVENFENDFLAFCDHVNLSGIEKKNSNVREAAEDVDYENGKYKYSDRMNRKSIDKINALFTEDFDLFGYARL